ncbi:hypothetical protein BC834DRAFT_970225 [Gloeopeniophorella convolvens]|nr:hypothetical protein BC834DRAFT_970225 [Gloeopeniophorella convolvens]
MRLQRGKSVGLLGSFRSIVREKGRGSNPAVPRWALNCSFRSLGRCLVPSLLLEAPKCVTELCTAPSSYLPHGAHRRPTQHHEQLLGKTFKTLFGKAEMTQKLSILTGCSARATESFVVVPFELVKIKLQDKSST